MQYQGAATDFFDGEIGNVQAYSRALSASEITALYSAGRTSTSGAGSAQQTTTTAYDQRGLPVSSTDPNGNTTSYAYDEAGQLAQTTEPAVSATVYSTSSGAPGTATAHPVATTGYNTSGDKTENQDPNGNTTTYTYDADGQLTSGTDPSYTPPGSSAVTPLTTYQYDPNGQLLSQTPQKQQVRLVGLYGDFGVTIRRSLLAARSMPTSTGRCTRSTLLSAWLQVVSAMRRDKGESMVGVSRRTSFRTCSTTRTQWTLSRGRTASRGSRT